MVTCLTDLTGQGYDAYVLKTVSEGPGMSILEAAEAVCSGEGDPGIDVVYVHGPSDDPPE